MWNPDFISIACFCLTLARGQAIPRKCIFLPSLNCINNKLESKGLRFRRKDFLSAFSGFWENQNLKLVSVKMSQRRKKNRCMMKATRSILQEKESGKHFHLYLLGRQREDWYETHPGARKTNQKKKEIPFTGMEPTSKRMKKKRMYMIS